MADETPKKPGLLTLEWFKPVERRAAVLVVIAGWVLFEWFVSHDQLFGMIAPAAFAYGVWSFFIDFDKQLAKRNDGKPKS